MSKDREASYFYSLVRQQTRKKRQCIKPNCRRWYISADAGDRVCCYCSGAVEKMGKLAEEV